MVDRRRAGVIIIDNGQIVLVERHRAGKHYFVCPGGGVEANESFEEAAVREAREELGLNVTLEGVALELEFGGKQVYFVARAVSGALRQGLFDEDKRLGTYRPVLVPLPNLTRIDVRPPELRTWARARSLID